MRLSHYLFIALVSLGLYFSTSCEGMQLGERLKGGQAGDYIVTEQDKMYTTLLLRSNDLKSIILEEISVPVSSVTPSINWKEWMQKGAPGHSSWTMYEIDTKDYSLIEAYSFTKRGWLMISEEEDFLGKLLKISLGKLSDQDRKKTGPLPQDGEPDHRKIWNPSIKIEGKKQKTACDVFKGAWPKDGTILSGCNITLYFPKDGPSFFFPYWIEASNGHYTHMIKTIDLGKGMSSPIRQSIPRRPPKISAINIAAENVNINITTPSYYKSFKVFVFDIIKPFEHIGPLPFTPIKSEKKGSFHLQAARNSLKPYLQEGHRYKWILVPEESSIFYVESEDIYLWKEM